MDLVKMSTLVNEFIEDLKELGVPSGGNFLISEHVLYKEIPGYTGYFISSYGQVISQSGKPLVLSNHYTGYKKIHLKDKQYYVHRIVMSVWNPHVHQDQLVVNHKDLDKSNNCLDNLEWVTGDMNATHSNVNHDYKKRLIECIKEKIANDTSKEDLLELLASL